MIPLLPKMYLHGNRPTFYDGDAVTMLELASTLHGAMNTLIDDYNKFVDNVNNTITEFVESTEKDLEVFKTAIRQEFQDFIDVVNLKVTGQDQKIDDFMEDSENKRETFEASMWNTYQGFVNNVEARMTNQDAEIAEAVRFMKTELQTSINNLLEDFKESGELSVMINDFMSDNLFLVTPKMYGAVGDGITDDTSAIQQCLNENNNVYFPDGTYRITAPITVRSGRNITGANKYHSRLYCDGCDAIHFAENGERGNFRSLGIFGDNSNHSAFVFNNNAVVWCFDDLWCREFGNSFFLANHNGCVNNIVIQNSQFEYGGKNCIEFIHSANSQINNVVVRACDISGFPSGNAIAITGNNILIEGCTIQAVDMGIRIDSTLSNDTTHPYHDSCGINIFSNYFEQVKKSYVFANVNYTAEHSGFLSGLTIIGNYGSRATDADPEYPAVKIVTDNAIYGKHVHNKGSMIGGVLYAGNSLSAGAGNVLIDGGGILTRGCVIVPDSISGTPGTPYALNNMGNALVINRYKTNTKTLRLYNGLLPDGATATNESVTIPAGSKFFYPIDINTIKELPLHFTFENTPTYGVYVRLHIHLKNGETLVKEEYVDPPTDGSLTVNRILATAYFCGYPDYTNEDIEDYDLEINPLSGPVTITNPVIEYFE